MDQCITSIDYSIKNGICPDGILKFIVMLRLGHSEPITSFINHLDDVHFKLHLKANDLSYYHNFGEIDGNNGHDEFEYLGRSESANGYGDYLYAEIEHKNKYGIPTSGNGYSYCEKFRWERFKIKNVTKK